MFEWDYASYERKFSRTIALTKVEGGDWAWRQIADISSEGVVSEWNMPDVLGEVLMECNNGKRQTNLPLVEFRYEEIKPGTYKHMYKPGYFYLLERRHIKSYKVGLSGEAYNIYEYSPGGANRKDYRCAIDMTKSLLGPIGKYHAFAPSLLLDGKSLYSYETEIGLLEEGRAILKDPGFIPLVKPYLGDAWEIVSL